MSFTVVVILALVPLAVIPPLIWFRQKMFRKLKERVSTQCERCGAYNTLDKLSNYTCTSCGHFHRFFDEEGRELPNLEHYECAYCGAENIKGVLTCTECAMANKAGRVIGE